MVEKSDFREQHDAYEAKKRAEGAIKSQPGPESPPPAPVPQYEDPDMSEDDIRTATETSIRVGQARLAKRNP